jgi:hypothetical protein
MQPPSPRKSAPAASEQAATVGSRAGYDILEAEDLTNLRGANVDKGLDGRRPECYLGRQ